MRNSNQIMHIILNRLLKMTKKINQCLVEGRIRDKNPKDIVFQITMCLLEAEEDLRERFCVQIEELFGYEEQEKLPPGITRLELGNDCPELLFLN